jgi:DNA-binding FadR family transcriptional regulator
VKLAPPEPADRGYRLRGAHGRLVHAIGQQILSGRLRPGEPLPRESELIARFQVSRTAIREATRVLAAKGLIESRQKAGTKVRPRTAWNLLDPDLLAWQSSDGLTRQFVDDLVELRQVIEPTAARLAASRATPGEIAGIAAAYERMAEAAGDREAYYSADLAFHMAIFSACHNELIRQLDGIVATVIEASFRLQSRSVIEPRASLGLHHAVLRQIVRHDAAAAERAMRRIIGRARLEAARLVEGVACATPKLRKPRRISRI